MSIIFSTAPSQESTVVPTAVPASQTETLTSQSVAASSSSSSSSSSSQEQWQELGRSNEKSG